MHTSLISLPVTLLSFVALRPLLIVSAISDRSMCVRQNAAMLADAAACGDRDSLRTCLLAAPGFVTLDDLQRCFIDAGCKIAEASSEAMIILKNCDESVAEPELRRRGPEAMPAATPRPKPQENNKNNAGSTSPATATTTAFAKPSECSTARDIETTVCPMTSLGPDKFSKLPCTTTTLTTMECASTNICFDDGNCIFRDDTVSASGIVVGVVLALVVVAAVAGIVFFYAKDRKARRLAREKVEEERRKRDEAEATAAALRKEAQAQVERERSRRQQTEAREWAHRRAAMEETQRRENPFDERVLA